MRPPGPPGGRVEKGGSSVGGPDCGRSLAKTFCNFFIEKGGGHITTSLTPPPLDALVLKMRCSFSWVFGPPAGPMQMVCPRHGLTEEPQPRP